METQNPATSAAEGIFGGDLGMNPPVNTPVQNTPVQADPVIQNEPVVNTPVNTPVETPANKGLIFEDEAPAEQPAWDENRYLTENFGTADKTVIKDRFSKYESTEKQLQEAALQLQQPKYKNKAAEVFDEILAKTGGDINTHRDFIKNTLDLLTTDEMQLDAVSLVKFNLKMNYPQLTAEQVDAHIAQSYMQGEEFTDEQRNAGAVKLMQDSTVAKTALSELKSKALANDNDKVVALQRLQEDKRKAEWKAPIEQMVEDFKTVKLNLGKVGGKNASINFEVPKEVAKGYQEMVYNSMIQQGILPTDESMAMAKQTLRALYIADNLDHLTQHVWSTAQSDSIKKEIGEYHNPSITGNGNQRIETTKVVSQDEAFAKSMGWNGGAN